MNFERVWPSGLGFKAIVSSLKLNQLDIDHAKAPNFADGSTHEPTGEVIVLGTHGVRFNCPVNGHWTPGTPITVDGNGFSLIGGADLHIGDEATPSLLEVHALCALHLDAGSVNAFSGLVAYNGVNHFVTANAKFTWRENATLLGEEGSVGQWYGTWTFYPASTVDFDGTTRFYGVGHTVQGSARLNIAASGELRVIGLLKVESNGDLDIASDGSAGTAKVSGQLRVESTGTLLFKDGAKLRSDGGTEYGCIDGGWLVKDTFSTPGAGNTFVTFKTGTRLTVDAGATLTVNGTWAGSTTRTGGVTLSGTGAWTRHRYATVGSGATETVDAREAEVFYLQPAPGVDQVVTLANPGAEYNGLIVQVVRHGPSSNFIDVVGEDGTLNVRLPNAGASATHVRVQLVGGVWKLLDHSGNVTVTSAG